MTDRSDLADAQPPAALGRIVLRGLFEDGLCPSGQFQMLSPGVEILPLYGLDPQGKPLSTQEPSAALLRYAPGASVPTHDHRGFEHILVLSGAQEDDFAAYPRGSFVVNPPGTRHRVKSDAGCLVLAIWTKPVEFVED